MLRLYNYYRSSASFRVRIALNIKGLGYQEVPVHLLHNGGEQFSPDYQKINPQQLIPSLQDDDKIITQSLAIIEYLDELHPSPPILPNDPYQKALVRSFALAIAADVHPLNNLRVLKYLTDELGISEEKKNVWYQHWIEKGLSALEKQVSSQKHASKFCFGDSVTMADIFLVPQLYNARRFHCNLNSFPNLARIDAYCQEQPAFQKAWPKEN